MASFVDRWWLGLGAVVLAGCATEFTEDPESFGLAPLGGSSGAGLGGAQNTPGSSGAANATGSPPVVVVPNGGAPGAAGSPAPPVSTGGQAGINTGLGGSGNGGSGLSGSPSSAGSAATGEELLFEDFEDGVADDWIADVDDGNDVVGMWAIVNGAYQEQVVYSDISFAIGGSRNWTDQALEADIQFTDAPAIDDATVILAVRFVDRDNYYFMELSGEGAVKIRKRVAGSTPELVSIDIGAVGGIGVTTKLRFIAQGTTLSVEVNGFPVMGAVVTDTDLAMGGVALGVVDAAASFDNVRVTLP